MSFPFYSQYDQMDCGPTCLKMIAKYFGRNYKLQTLRDLCGFNKEGVSLLGISVAAEAIGFRTLAVRLSIDHLKVAEMPCIIHWRKNHFVVLYKIKKNKYFIADPGDSLIVLNENEFRTFWVDKDTSEGIALLLSPTPNFFENDDEVDTNVGWNFFFKYLYKYKKLIIQLFFGLGITSILQLITPFLTQAIVDIGINTKNLSFVHIILISQAMLILGRISVEFIRSWILLQISARINIEILTDFLMKLMKLPMNFFDTKMTGDIMQRMSDQRVIQNFLSGSALSTMFSIFNLFIFSIVLVYYNFNIFLVFAICSVL